jgi:hypothetical protein
LLHLPGSLLSQAAAGARLSAIVLVCGHLLPEAAARRVFQNTGLCRRLLPEAVAEDFRLLSATNL